MPFTSKYRKYVNSRYGNTVRPSVYRRKYPRVAKVSTMALKMTNTKIFNFKRTCILDQLYVQPDGSPGVDLGKAYSFQLNQLPEYTEFTKLFDYYRIKCVVLKLIPVSIQTMVNGPTSDTNSSYCPMVYTSVDTNDATTPISETEILQRLDCKTFPMTKFKTFKIYPKAQNPVYRDSVGNAYGEEKKTKWINSDYPDVDYYGFKVYIKADGNFSNVFTTRVIATFYLQMKTPK